MKNKLAKNSLAVGLATMIVTAGLSFSAQAADTYDYKSYAEAQYIAAGGALGEALVDPLADFLEGGDFGVDDNSAGAASKVDTAGGTTEVSGPAYTASPLDPLAGLTGPIGDLVGSNGASLVSSYTKAQRDGSVAAAGLVTDQGGLVDVDSIPDASEPKGLKLNLSGPGQPLAAVDALANVVVELPAGSSRVELAENAPNAPIRGYSLAGGKITAEVAAVAGVLDQLGGLDAIGDLDISLPVIGGVKVTGVGDLLDSLTTLTAGGLTVDLNSTTVTLDIEDLVFAATGKKLNQLDPNTPLLPAVVDGVALAVPELVTQLNTQVLEAIQGIDLELSLLGSPPVTIPLSDLTGELLAPLQDGIDAIVSSVLTPVLDATLPGVVTPLLTALEDVIDVRVNVWENAAGGGYRGLVADRTGTAGVYSVSALRVQLLGAIGNGGLADLYLGNSLVGPNSRTVVVNQDDANSDANADQDGDAQSDADSVSDADAQSDADADAASDADTAADSVADADADANADAVADADAQSDADVTQALPDAGAGRNLLPFMLLGLALALFGGGVLLNEKRRIMKS